MRLLIGILILFLTLCMGYIKYEKYKKALAITEFIKQFTKEFIYDHRHEMKGMSVVFCEEYFTVFGEKISLLNSLEVIEYIKRNFNEALESNYISLLEKFGTSGVDLIDDVSAVLLQETEKYSTEAKKRYNEIGKSILLLFPAVSLILLILLL